MRVLALVILFLSLCPLAFAVPAPDLEKEFRGEVVRYSVFRAGLREMYPKNMVLYEIVVSSENRSSSAVSLLSKRPLPSWLFGKTLRVKAVYVGDEHGGVYWLKRILEVR
ncbi:hypothetical protein [Hydrogenivirga sp. 128-5-R1-1]|uniref:hypothetical protein n=1 Tax=Hydrogenivirga sp. 128-5-R1-1 TaxID=392423 RepID=UPI00015EF73A|nr:hypothetical protein [Hydrogenivirga sp. 128-5-R1-1]EDP74947.1 hypothetical protein HG1285_13802 [Hydrogenivirga sp. 128-5-R1-1]